MQGWRARRERAVLSPFGQAPPLVMPTASVRAPESSSSKELRMLFASGRPLLYIVSPEERRVGLLLREAAQAFFPEPVPFWSWSMTEGMQRSAEGPPAKDTGDPRAALDFIIDSKGPGIFHLKDFHEPLRESAGIRRRLRDVYARCIDHGRHVVISSPVRFIPDELQREILCIELKVPDAHEIGTFLAERAAAITAGGGTVDTSEASMARMTGALHGLTLDEAGFAIRRAVADGSRLGVASIPALLEEKRLAVNRTGTIEYIAEGGKRKGSAAST